MAWTISGGITQHNWSICGASFALMPSGDCGFSGRNTSALIKYGIDNDHVCTMGYRVPRIR